MEQSKENKNLKKISVLQSYEELNLTEDSSLAEINARYKLLLEEFDPEKQTDDLKEFFKMEREKVIKSYDTILKYLSENKNTESGKVNEEVKNEIEELAINKVEEHNDVNFEESETNEEEAKEDNTDYSMFKKPFSFEGRIRRTEYGITVIIYTILSSIMQFAVIEIPFLFIFWIPMIWFYIAQGAKRCHDRGNSGWYQIIPFYSLWMIFGNSDVGENEYVPRPKK